MDGFHTANKHHGKQFVDPSDGKTTLSYREAKWEPQNKFFNNNYRKTIEI